MTSRRIMAGRCLATALMAASPRLQTATSKPSLAKTSSSPSKMCGSSSTMRILFFISNRFQRQPQTETTAAGFARFINDIAAVGPRDLARERQAEARALDAAAQGIVGAVELLEDLLGATIRHAQPAIKHLYFHIRQRIALLLDLQSDFFAAI